MIKQIACILLMSTCLIANAQNKEVNIIKKKGKVYKTILDTSVNAPANVDTNINLSIIVDGDKITINGKPADKNDPRLKIINRGPLSRKGKATLVPDDQNANEEEEDMEMFATPAPPTNAAFLGVITEANEKGAKINTVSEGSPAEKAGLKQNDIIHQLNDKVVDGPQALYEAVGDLHPEDKVSISYFRDGTALKTTATLAKNKGANNNNNRQFNYFYAPNGQMPNTLRRGFKISPDQNFNFEMPTMPEMDGLLHSVNKKPKLGISIEDMESGNGVKINRVSPSSPAEKGGLKPNDIITQFDNHKVTDVSDLKWEYLQEGQVLKFEILRNGEKKNIEVKIPKKLKTADL